MRTMHGLQHLIAAMFTIIWFSASGMAQTPVAMVTDTKGEVRINDQVLALVTVLSPGDLIEVGESSSLLIVYYDSSMEYTYSGPAQVRIEMDAPVTLRGIEPAKRFLSLFGGDIRIDPTMVVQGMLVMRAAEEDIEFRLFEPVGTILGRRPLFRWEAIGEGLSYKFTLSNESGETLVDTFIEGTEFTLPQEIILEDGAIYVLTLWTRTATGKLVSNWSEFTVLEAQKRTLIEQLKPPADAPFTERVVFASVLQQWNVRSEAKSLWKMLLAERPDDPNLRALAGE